jgi:MinD-like ATPase involved in chromosome partitioning or flagellar assembly
MMRGERYVVLGLANVRAPWFGEVARWATTGAVPIDFVKCVSPEEVRARLDAGRSLSALIADGNRVGLERDLIDAARRVGCAVIVVDEGRRGTDWRALGAVAVLSPTFTRTELVAALAGHSAPIGRVDDRPRETAPLPDAPWQGRTVAVTGPGGTGASTIAMALAQALGTDARNRGLVCLADLALDAELAMFHDARDVVPGLLELVDACRNGVPTAGLSEMVFTIGDRGYDLLLGLRRHRDWTALRPRALETAIATLRRNYRVVVADVEPDIEGEEETGSADVADRNHLARHVLHHADLVLVVGAAGIKGMHALVRTVHQLRGAGVAPTRIVPVLNQVGRGPRQRAELTHAFRTLCDPAPASDDRGNGPALSSPIFVPSRRRLDGLIAQAAPLPDPLCRPLGAAVAALLERLPRATAAEGSSEPVVVTAGSLGVWHDTEGAA